MYVDAIGMNGVDTHLFYAETDRFPMLTMRRIVFFCYLKGSHRCCTSYFMSSFHLMVKIYFWNTVLKLFFLFTYINGKYNIGNVSKTL